MHFAHMYTRNSYGALLVILCSPFESPKSVSFLFYYLFVYLFIYIPNAAHLLVLPCWVLLPILSPSSLRGQRPPPQPPDFSTLANQVSAGWGISSPTETRHDSPLLHTCQGPRTSLYMLLSWYLHLCKLPGVQVSWHASQLTVGPCGVVISLRTFSSYPNASMGVLALHLMFVCGYLDLSQSALDQASHRAALGLRGSCGLFRFHIPTVGHFG